MPRGLDTLSDKGKPSVAVGGVVVPRRGLAALAWSTSGPREHVPGVPYRGRMVTIRIGEASRPIAEAEESWIAQQINQRQRAGLPVCIEVVIHVQGLNIRLATEGCGSGGGGGRVPTAEERTIIDLWNRMHMTDVPSAGNVIAFLKQLARRI